VSGLAGGIGEKPVLLTTIDFTMTSMPIGEEWVGRTLDERFPLLQWLGGGAECGVFLTERPGGNGNKAAIKVMPAGLADAERRVEGWEAARGLEHPHLLRVYEYGRCQMDGGEFAYVLTEYAPEVLAEILPERALTTEEARAVLDPLLDVLEYLHGKGLVHGHVKPGNILAQGDVLKLTADDLSRAGAADVSTDVWLVGVTLVEMLTQRPPEAGANGGLVAPAGLSEPFGSIASACLRVNPEERCDLAEIRSRLKGEATEGTRQKRVTDSVEGTVTVAGPVTVEDLRQVAASASPQSLSEGTARSWMKLWVWATGVLVLVLLLLVLWHSLPDMGGKSAASAIASAPEVAATVPQPANEPGVVVRRVPPEVLQSALETIYGTVQVDVRVTAGTGGRVIDAEFADRGPSRYFARAAMAAARQWVFEPAQVKGIAVRSVWLLKFAFTRDGAQVTATEVSP
jgi:TonB family protein